ncbi:MAG TPA: hypothetical protein VGQ51_16690 [Puia sp.]|jgi:Spy/CpxP family protein refolding chaperone|nr:hypothetical protein [Puia sp.]
MNFRKSNDGPSANGRGVRLLIACATLVTSLLFVSSTFAQGGGMRGDTAAMRQRMEAQLAKMKTDLNLTQTQCDSVKAIQMDQRAAMRQIFMDPANQGLSREDRMAKMQPINEAMIARLNAALGADLSKKVQDWMQANRPQRGGGGNR